MKATYLNDFSLLASLRKHVSKTVILFSLILLACKSQIEENESVYKVNKYLTELVNQINLNKVDGKIDSSSFTVDSLNSSLRATVIYNSEDLLSVKLVFFFFNELGSESAYLVETIEGWEELPGISSQSDFASERFEQIRPILKSSNISFEKSTYARKNNKGHVLLFAKNLRIEADKSKIDDIVKILSLYFSNEDVKNLQFSQR